MSNRWLILTFILCGLPQVASAQNPTVALTIERPALSIEALRINIEDLVEDDVDPSPYLLSWTVSGLPAGAWDYELNYGAITETSTAPTRLRVIETDGFAEAQGDQPLIGQLQVEVFLRDLIEDAEDLPTALGGTGRDDFDQPVCVNIYPSGNPDFNQTFTDCLTFEADTLPPEAPQISELVPGENRVLVRWTPLSDTRIDFYQAVYCTNASTLTISFEELPCSGGDRRNSPTISDTLSETSISDGILNGERVVVAMRSIDEFDNVGEPGDVDDTFPTSVDDFFELYDGAEAGGFCFIATAAYGSYAHPLVKVLRVFRDRVLNVTPLGAAFVWAYYRYAPPLAEQVAANSALAGWVRVWLVPVALIALVIMLLPFVAVGWLGFRAFRWAGRSTRTRIGATGTVAALIVAMSGSTAEAGRPESSLDVLGVGFEFKGGPYSGAIQDEPGFSDVFDDESRPLFTFGVDVQVYRGFGTVTVGPSFGFLQYTGKGLFGKGSRVPGSRSSDTNVFNLVPLTLQAGYRFDLLADQTWVPFVPYVKGGLAYYIWWATNGVGGLQRRTLEEDRQTARGGTFGLTGTLGLAFMLNKIESRVAQSLFANSGIRGTYIFIEMTGSQVDDFGGEGFDLSDFNWNLGLYMEL